ncbi:MAG TPA: sulfatase-like hydrolase/transferase, partial [Thermoanaerobaculia bacterium]|nr:sulfatase-like hydrolase/transferase [Thermoanaerobaculia bacterium]
NGYATGAAVSAYVLRKEAGLSRGFDFYDDQIDPANSGVNVGRVQRKGSETAEVATKWIAQHERSPFFFFLHLYEPHSPYDPPEPYRSRYPSHYDGEIAHADEIVGAFLESLKRDGIYDDALIVILSDHGEGLGDHRELEHGVFLYREALQVPLMLKLPKNAMHGQSVATPVQLSDVFATITAQTATKSGLSLVDIARGEKPQRRIYSETLFPKFHYGWSDLHSLLDDRRHYIQAPRPELYDLAADPAEKRDILNDDRRAFVAMRNAIVPMIKASAAPSAISAEDAKKLAALGYIGSAVPADEKNLPDPKDKIETAAELRRAFQLYDDAKYADALPLLEKLVRENDRMLDVWDILARTYDHLGRTDAAIEAAKHGFKLSPNTTHLALMIATLSIDAHRLDDAEKHADLALATEPGMAHDILARIALERGQLDDAEKEAKLALETRDLVFALVTLGKIELQRKNYAAGLAWCDRAVKVLDERKGTAVKGLYYLRGDLLARMERFDEAEKSFLEEIDLFPRDPQAYKNLILLYVTEGRDNEATKLVFALVDRAPFPPSYVAVAQTLKTVGDARGARYWTTKGLEKFPDDPNLRKLAKS